MVSGWLIFYLTFTDKLTAALLTYWQYFFLQPYSNFCVCDFYRKNEGQWNTSFFFFKTNKKTQKWCPLCSILSCFTCYNKNSRSISNHGFCVPCIPLRIAQLVKVIVNQIKDCEETEWKVHHNFLIYKSAFLFREIRSPSQHFVCWSRLNQFLATDSWRQTASYPTTSSCV